MRTQRQDRIGRTVRCVTAEDEDARADRAGARVRQRLRQTTGEAHATAVRTVTATIRSVGVFKVALRPPITYAVPPIAAPAACVVGDGRLSERLNSRSQRPARPLRPGARSSAFPLSVSALARPPHAGARLVPTTSRRGSGIRGTGRHRGRADPASDVPDHADRQQDRHGGWQCSQHPGRAAAPTLTSDTSLRDHQDRPARPIPERARSTVSEVKGMRAKHGRRA